MLEQMPEIAYKRISLKAFAGINKTSASAPGEFADMLNMSNVDYPALTVRKPLKKTADINGICGFIVTQNDIYVLQSYAVVNPEPPPIKLKKYRFCRVVNGNAVEISGFGDIGYCKLSSFGAYILLFGERTKKYYNTKTGESGNIDKIYDNSETHRIKYSVCWEDGSDIGSYTRGASPPESIENGALWYNTSTKSLLQYSAASAGWISVVTPYIKLQDLDGDITNDFKLNDGIEFASNSSDLKEIARYNAISAIDYENKHIVLTGLVSQPEITMNAHIQLRREVPKMDYIFTHEGRLWGCNSENHEIYVSASGSFSNFIVFDGKSYDSWAATIASDGDFTGACSYGGYPYFFKKDKIYKIYGSMPSEYSIDERNAAGAEDGTLAEINGVLYYRANGNIYAYTGSSYPSVISKNIPEADFSGGAAAYKDSYLIGNYVYDTQKGLWSKSSIKITNACEFGNTTYLAQDDSVLAIGDTGDKIDIGIEHGYNWLFETAFIGTDLPDDKRIYGIRIRFSADAGTRFRVRVKANGGEWTTGYIHEGKTALKSAEVPITPLRCDYFQIRTEGQGGFKLQSISYNVR